MPMKTEWLGRSKTGTGGKERELAAARRKPGFNRLEEELTDERDHLLARLAHPVCSLDGSGVVLHDPHIAAE